MICNFYAVALFLISTLVTVSSETNNNGFVLRLLETEVWDEANQIWRASGERWSNENGQASLSPSEVYPPDDFAFSGDWKIALVSAGDSLGWEYQFQFLQQPKRTRIWLRSLRQITGLQPKQPFVGIGELQPKGSLSRSLARIRDDWNFKGWSFSLYKSLIFPSSIAFAIRLPLSINFDILDRHPELPNFSTNICFMYPWTIACFLSGSVHLEWVKWVLKCIFQVIPRLVIFCIYDAVLPFLWVIASVITTPLGLSLPPLPKAPTLFISKPQYNPELSERIGGSVSYRWSQKRGREWRLSYWHSYLPTLAVYRKMLRMNTPMDWWQKHFGSIGLSTSYPIPIHPHFSCSAHLFLSGLFLKGRSDENKLLDNTFETKQVGKNEMKQQQQEDNLRNRDLAIPPRLISTTATAGVL